MGHALMYAFFAFSCLWGYRKQFTTRGNAYRRRAILITISVSIVYGGITEIMQEAFVPGRTGDWFDFLADAIGTCLGATLFYLFFKNKK